MSEMFKGLLSVSFVGQKAEKALNQGQACRASLGPGQGARGRSPSREVSAEANDV